MAWLISGVGHGWDAMFAWGYSLISDAPEELQRDTGYLGNPLFHPNEADQAWNNYYMDLLTNFAKYGSVSLIGITY